MWLVALMGFIVKFSEITLGMAYRERDPETGKWHGGFYWYVRRGLGKNWKWLGIIWAIILGCAMVFAPAVQINSVVESVRTSFDIPPIIIGVISAVLMFIVLIGGIKSLSHFAEVVVPFMALAYTVVSIIILIMSAGKIPGIFGMIFQYAFTPMAATGGFAGSTVVLAIRWGLARGVYSNEAGTGMAPLARSSSSANHPVKQGLWGITEVFVDTIVVCTMTALSMLTTGLVDLETGRMLSPAPAPDLAGEAFSAALGPLGPGFVAGAVLLFAWSSVLGWSQYGAECWAYLFGPGTVWAYRLAFLALILPGATAGFTAAWALSDTFNGLMMLPNLAGLFALSGQVTDETKQYLRRLDQSG